MNQISQEKIAAIAEKIRKPHVNSTCIGCSACASITHEVFELDNDGLSCVRSLADYESYAVDDAIAACPVNAISWQTADPTGNYLNGVVEHKDVA